MAARKRVYHDPATIERIRESVQAAQLVKTLREHVLAGTELKNSQVKAADILLRKIIPDMATVAHTGENGGAIQHKMEIGWKPPE